MLTSAHFDTPLGDMIAVSDEKVLHLLSFMDYKNIDHQLVFLQRHLQKAITNGSTSVLDSIQKELRDYFTGQLKKFHTPIHLSGSSFQQCVWETLQKIPYGETLSYTDLAFQVGNPRAYRAVANANAANLLTIIVPCHRVINHNGNVGGYGGGVERKQRLLELEKAKRITKNFLQKG